METFQRVPTIKKGDKLFTSHSAAALLQVDASSIANWIRAGHLNAFRTPGGHIRIRTEDLLNFLTARNMPVPAEILPVEKRRLLIVDDEAKQLAAYRKLLKPYSGRVEVVLLDNGIDALVQVGAFKPHLILLDFFMPDVDGLEVCRRLKASPTTKSIDLVIVSGQLTHEIEKKALAVGVRACIAKPLRPKQILEELGFVADPFANSAFFPRE